MRDTWKLGSTPFVGSCHFVVTAGETSLQVVLPRQTPTHTLGFVASGGSRCLDRIHHRQLADGSSAPPAADPSSLSRKISIMIYGSADRSGRQGQLEFAISPGGSYQNDASSSFAFSLVSPFPFRVFQKWSPQTSMPLVTTQDEELHKRGVAPWPAASQLVSACSPLSALPI
jgi:hypothetical protein